MVFLRRPFLLWLNPGRIWADAVDATGEHRLEVMWSQVDRQIQIDRQTDRQIDVQFGYESVIILENLDDRYMRYIPLKPQVSRLYAHLQVLYPSIKRSISSTCVTMSTSSSVVIINIIIIIICISSSTIATTTTTTIYLSSSSSSSSSLHRHHYHIQWYIRKSQENTHHIREG